MIAATVGARRRPPRADALLRANPDEPRLRELLARVAQGDERALDGVIKLATPEVQNVLSRRFPRLDADWEEDVLSEVWRRVWKYAHGKDPNASAFGWVTTLAVNTALTRIRRTAARRVEVPWEAAFPSVEPSAERSSEAFDPLHYPHGRAVDLHSPPLASERTAGVWATVSAALEELNPAERMVLTWWLWDGLSDREIGARLVRTADQAREYRRSIVARIRSRVTLTTAAEGGLDVAA